jgi:preprotein translocase subunit SecY
VLKVRRQLSPMSLLFVAGIVDSVVLTIAVFAAIANLAGESLALSVRILLLAFALLVVLAILAVVDEHQERRRTR